MCKGPCAKRVVTATIRTFDGREFVGTNYCLAPQKTCPRGDMPGGKGYLLCKTICRQPAHAEENAIEAAGDEARGATMLVRGIDWICPSCKKSVKDAGLRELLVTVEHG